MPNALNGSHLVIATENVQKLENFFRTIFGVEPHYSHKEFTEFVLPGKFRIAFFRPVGAAAKFFTAQKERSQIAIGITVKDVDAVYAQAVSQAGIEMGLTVSGPPKDHPWGEKSFLLLDMDSNRWEITQSPSKDGFLVNR